MAVAEVAESAHRFLLLEELEVPEALVHRLVSVLQQVSRPQLLEVSVEQVTPEA